MPGQAVAVTSLGQTLGSAAGEDTGEATSGANCPWEGAQDKYQPCGHYETGAICCHTPIIECNLNFTGASVMAKYLRGF